MASERELILKIESENDSTLIYRYGDKVNLVITSSDAGDSEVFLSAEDAEKIAAALNTVGKQIKAATRKK